jgi:PAS domain S-box-containing protein
VEPPQRSDAARGDRRASADDAQAVTETGSHNVELTASEWADLLDPKSWANILTLYARSMGVAVALVDPQGRLLGTCHNPQPIWSLARAAKPEWDPGCPFCLDSPARCTAADDALRTDSLALAHDKAGFAHTASPLSLGGRHLGLLMAGQVLDRFAEPIPLQRMARDFGLSSQQVWHLARQQAPISRSHLTVYGDLLCTLGQAFLRERYSAVLERRLADTNLRFHLLVDGVQDYAIFTLDAAGLVNSWNNGAERLLGYTEAEILGRPFSLVFIPADIENGVPQRDLQTAARQSRVVNERWYIRKDGSRLFVSGILAPVGEGDAREFGMIMHNITDRLKAESARLQKQKLESLGVLAAGVAHDFNNLLTSILGNASLLLDATSEFDPQLSSLESIVSSGQKAATLTKQMLAYAGMGNYVFTRIDLSQLIAGMLPVIQATIPKAVRLELAVAVGLPSIEADATQIRQLLMDLVINSAEAIGAEGGTVWVTTGFAGVQPDDDGKPERFVYVEVRDSGCGMDQSVQAKIFDPFFTTKFMGRGLGLAAVSGIVRGLKGTMRVESAPGKGTTFRISLPALSDVSTKTAV